MNCQSTRSTVFSVTRSSTSPVYSQSVVRIQIEIIVSCARVHFIPVSATKYKKNIHKSLCSLCASKVPRSSLCVCWTICQFYVCKCAAAFFVYLEFIVGVFAKQSKLIAFFPMSISFRMVTHRLLHIIHEPFCNVQNEKYIHVHWSNTLLRAVTHAHTYTRAHVMK